MAAEEHDDEELREEFERQIDEAARWWGSAQELWRTPRLFVAVAHQVVPGRRPVSARG